jgi:hypothetical protein
MVIMVWRQTMKKINEINKMWYSATCFILAIIAVGFLAVITDNITFLWWSGLIIFLDLFMIATQYK